MFFSVEPSSYHDITSLNEGDDETPALESLPFRVLHASSAPKKRHKKTTAPSQTERKKPRREMSDSEGHDESYKPPRGAYESAIRGRKRAKKEVLPGGTVRSRRVVMNNVTVQSVYMCL